MSSNVGLYVPFEHHKSLHDRCIWKIRLMPNNTNQSNNCKERSEDDFDDLQSDSQPDSASFGSLLRKCGDGKIWKDGMLVHHHIIEHGLAHDAFLQGLLVQMYGKCGHMDHALHIFRAMPEHSAFSWNFIIRASAQQEYYQEALDLFNRMQQEGAAPDKFTYVCAFAACTGKGDFLCSMQLHARIVNSTNESDTVIGTAVVNMYGKCGRINDARSNFQKMNEHDVISWNVMLAIYAEHDQMEQALQLFSHMRQQSYLPTRVSFLSVLDVCAIRSDLVEGKRVHVCILAGGMEVDIMVENALVKMYGKCCLQHARAVFQLMYLRNVVTWTTMIASCAEHEQMELAFHLYDQMCQEGVLPEKVTFLEILAACSNSVWLLKGERLLACLTGVDDDMIMTEVVNMYGRCDSVENARKVFDSISSQSIVAWNTMISVYSQHGEADEAFLLFARMLSKVQTPTRITFISMLGACIKIVEGRTLHALVIESYHEAGTIMSNAIMSMYSRHLNIEDAWSIFSSMGRRDLISWNTMIAAYALDERIGIGEVFGLLEKMVNEGITPDKVTYTTILEAYAHYKMPRVNDPLGSLGSDGEWVQAAGSASVNKLSEPATLQNVRRLFYEVHEHDVRAWNAMINICVSHNEESAACSLFNRMLEEAFLPNRDSFIAIISACTSERALIDGKRLHSCITCSEFEAEFAVGTALVTMYGKNLGVLIEARKAFDQFTYKNVVLWTAMISVYAQGWHGDEGFKLFLFMQQCGVLPNKVTYVSALEACVAQGSLCEGKSLHACISGGGFLSDVPVITSLIDMYSKCGKLDDAWEIFDQAPAHDILLYNTMISLYSQHGDALRALKVFEAMAKEGMKADKVTFISILTACSHCGLIEDGFYWLSTLQQDHELSANSAHYNCMIDVVGRAGQLEIAWSLASRMPFQPTEVPYIMLLRACQQAADVKHGGWAATHSFEVGGENTAPYVLLSNIHMVDNRILLAEPFLAKEEVECKMYI
ncbi:hypothetical protein GOP47_0027760 [Adiantum capillus-veneris]|nr:hypothetical protein GOP47_0027760 [Adiantum capillus-veneris]